MPLWGPPSARYETGLALKTQEIQEFTAAEGAEPADSTPQAQGACSRRDAGRYAKIVRAENVCIA
jgi:hypothetical protein